MKEIGGYFQLDQLVQNPYYGNMVELNTGRNALIYLVKAKNIKKLYIPYFLCDSISNVLDLHSIDYEYYHIDESFMPIFDKDLKKNEYLFIVNYYGQLSNSVISLLSNKYGRIIVDNTQAFFQRPLENIDTVYSCRKFFGVPDGAYLSTNKLLDEELEVDSSRDRMTHILGRYEINASTYYADFKDNDKFLGNLPLKRLSKLTKNILGAIDYQKIAETRQLNYVYLDNELKGNNQLKLIMPEVPFSYPVYVNNGIEIRKNLAKYKTYIPTLWPNVLADTNEDSLEYVYAANILPLPCDQRYGIEDMKIILEKLNLCLEN